MNNRNDSIMIVFRVILLQYRCNTNEIYQIIIEIIGLCYVFKSDLLLIFYD